MKINSTPLCAEKPEDSLSVYLDLKKRVEDLERELGFTKLTINALYLEIKELKRARQTGGEG